MTTDEMIQMCNGMDIADLGTLQDIVDDVMEMKIRELAEAEGDGDY